jgi:hypothetical protein
MWMNEYEIAEARDEFATDPILGPAAQFLYAFKNEVNAHSDGWCYWKAPAHAAAKLQDLLHKHLRATGAWPPLPEPTEADVRRTLAPIKSFMTRRGNAAGMRLPVLGDYDDRCDYCGANLHPCKCPDSLDDR